MPARSMQGRVLKKKNLKTCVVEVSQRKRDRRLRKFYTSNSHYQVHDEGDVAAVDDVVIIRECRPMSRTKRWNLESVVSKASLPRLEEVLE